MLVSMDLGICLFCRLVTEGFSDKFIEDVAQARNTLKAPSSIEKAGAHLRKPGLPICFDTMLSSL